jgi:membrane fusion protein (multidrug efflux system)
VRLAIPALLLSLLSPLLLAGCGDAPAGPPAGPPPAAVQVVTAEARTLPRTLSAVGSLESADMTAIAAEIPGTVIALDVPEGTRVEEGHVVARLDDAEARAALSVASARLENARARLARQQPLHAQGVASDQALDDARAELRSAEGAFNEARTRLEKHTIRAPIGGRLGLRQVNVGQYVPAGQPIVEITLADALELRFYLPQKDLPLLAPGQKVHGVVGRCEARFEGQVTAVDPRVDPTTRMVGLQAVVKGEPGTLSPGMAVRVRLQVGELPGAILLPQEAIVRQGTKYVVYTADGQDQAQPREVVLGEFFVDGVHVASGISAGDRVIVSGQQKLQPGSLIVPKPFEPTHNPNVQVGRYGPADCEPT